VSPFAYVAGVGAGADTVRPKVVVA
jgi:hypothetical protein